MVQYSPFFLVTFYGVYEAKRPKSGVWDHKKFFITNFYTVSVNEIKTILIFFSISEANVTPIMNKTEDPSVQTAG